MSEEVVLRNQFGVCPRCGKPLLLIQSLRTAYLLAPTGWIRKEVSQNISYRVYCDCGFNMKMKITPGGLVPNDFIGDIEESKLLVNPLGDEDNV